MKIMFLRVLVYCTLLLSTTAALAKAEVTHKDYVLGNSLLTLLHEIGHAVVDYYQLPVVGREEDAADTFSILVVTNAMEEDTALNDTEINQLDQYFFYGALQWLAYSEESDLEDYSLYAGSHSLDQQRLFTHLCLLSGFDSDYYPSFAEELELSEYMPPMEECEENYDIAQSNWQHLLENYGHNALLGEQEITIQIDPHPVYADLLQAWPWLSYFEKRLEEQLILPRPLLIRFHSCKEPDAWYDPETLGIEICYALMDEYARYYERTHAH